MNQDPQQSVVCPICKSNSLSANKQTFNNTNAILGNTLIGGTKGMMMGFIDTGKIVITCLSCGYTFKPGEGANESDFEVKHNLAVQKIESQKSSRTFMRIFLIFLLIIIILVPIIWINSLRDNQNDTGTNGATNGVSANIKVYKRPRLDSKIIDSISSQASYSIVKSTKYFTLIAYLDNNNIQHKGYILKIVDSVDKSQPTSTNNLDSTKIDTVSGN